MNPDKQAYHVVFVTHNSRTSRRMIKYLVQKGPPVRLSLDEEIALTQIIGQIIREKGYHCLAYNICQDHLHLILVCKPEQLTDIVKTIKGKSSFLFGQQGWKPKGTKLWAKKFFQVHLDTWKLVETTPFAGFEYDDDYLENALAYIRNNRSKHKLPASDDLIGIISTFILREQEAFQ